MRFLCFLLFLFVSTVSGLKDACKKQERKNYAQQLTNTSSCVHNIVVLSSSLKMIIVMRILETAQRDIASQPTLGLVWLSSSSRSSKAGRQRIMCLPREKACRSLTRIMDGGSSGGSTSTSSSNIREMMEEKEDDFLVNCNKAEHKHTRTLTLVQVCPSIHPSTHPPLRRALGDRCHRVNS